MNHNKTVTFTNTCGQTAQFENCSTNTVLSLHPLTTSQVHWPCLLLPNLILHFKERKRKKEALAVLTGRSLVAAVCRNKELEIFKTEKWSYLYIIRCNGTQESRVSISLTRRGIKLKSNGAETVCGDDNWENQNNRHWWCVSAPASLCQGVVADMKLLVFITTTIASIKQKPGGGWKHVWRR